LGKLEIQPVVNESTELEHLHQMEHIPGVDFGEDGGEIFEGKLAFWLTAAAGRQLPGGEQGPDHVGAQPIGRQNDVVDFRGLVPKVDNFTDLNSAAG
jgi:hypothetical protein